MGMLDCLPVQDADLVVAEDRPDRAFHIEVDRVTESQWSELLNGFDDANIYQTWAYGAVRWGEKNLSHLLLKRGSEVVAISQLRIVRLAHLPMGVAYLRWGPLCHRRGTELNREVVSGMANALRQEYVTRRGLYLEVLPNAFSDSPRAELFRAAFCEFDHKAGISKEQYRTLVLDLTPPLEQLRKHLDKKWRNQLSAAERNHLEIISGNGGQEYSQFCALYKQMWRRKRFDSGVSIDEFHRIQERLPEAQRLRVLICRWEGNPVGGLVCSALGQSAIYLLGATNEEGMKVKSSYLLQWAAIQSLKEDRIRLYDLGGIDPAANPGVHHFKSGLSGADMSHMGALTTCDSNLSATLIKVGQLVRDTLRALQPRATQAGLSEATR